MNSDTSDIIADIKSIEPVNQRKQTRNFPDIYKEKVFYIWYNHGKPQEGKLLTFIPVELDEWERLPSLGCLKTWIDTEYVPRAKLLDEQVKLAMDAAMITEKVEMLKRHADLGVQMQNMAVRYLNENQDIISSPAAVRLLVEGIRIERESRGIPEALEKITRMTDEDLMAEINRIMLKGTVSPEEENANR